MIITPDAEFRAAILKMIRDREFGERTGVHQSDLNYCLNRSALRKILPIKDTDRETLLFSLGYSTQRWLTGQDKDEDTVEIDGIKVTLDSTASGCPWELKATYTSSTKTIEENVPWLRQIMAQCYVTGTQQAKLTRFCIMGNWLWVWNGRAKPEKLSALIAEHGENWDDRPVLQAWNLEFTQDELNRNWDWFKVRRDIFLQILETKELVNKIIALPSGQEYECERCVYKKECEENCGGS